MNTSLTAVTPVVKNASKVSKGKASRRNGRRVGAELNYHNAALE